MIKMTCAVNWIIVRERRAESTSLSRPDLAGSRGKTVLTSLVPCILTTDSNKPIVLLRFLYVRLFKYTWIVGVGVGYKGSG